MAQGSAGKDHASSSLNHYQAPKDFWLLCLIANSYVDNRMDKADGKPSSHQLLTGVVPDNTHIRRSEFGVVSRWYIFLKQTVAASGHGKLMLECMLGMNPSLEII